MHSRERRREPRIRYLWPAWFGYQENGTFLCGQVHDASRNALCITVRDYQCPAPGEHLLTRFSYPLPQHDEFQMGHYYDWAKVIRVDSALPGQRRVALALQKSLAHNPAQNELEKYLVESA